MLFTGSGDGHEHFENTSGHLPDDNAKSSSFAPRGPPRTPRSQVYNMLPGPLQLQPLSARFPWHRLRDSCLVRPKRPRQRPVLTRACTQSVVSSGISQSEDERFLERFRYIIIASQLLVERSRPISHQFDSSVANAGLENHSSTSSEDVSLQGVIVTTMLSFTVAFSFHCLRAQVLDANTVHWTKACMLLLFITALAQAIYVYFQRRTSLRYRRDAIAGVSLLITQARALSDLARAAFMMIQEIEIVARGYQM